METHNTFSPLSLPLSGTQLIEASAGTGKTHTITDLYLRLILEKGLPVDQILVVTYTEAATEELRDRVRKKLRKAKDALSAGGGSDDPVISELMQKKALRGSAHVVLQNALANFDEAAIYTIHGFCNRMLNDLAYETGSLFDTELITCQGHLIRETVDDFWREHFYQAHGCFISYALEQGYTPDVFLHLANSYIHNPSLAIIPVSETPRTKEAETSYIECFKEVAEAWEKAGSRVREILTAHTGLNRKKYRVAAVETLLGALEHHLASSCPCLLPADTFEKFTTGAIAAGTKKNMDPPEHPFFHLFDVFHARAENLCILYDRYLCCLKVSFFDYARRALEQKKAEMNIQYYDDLLLKVHKALAAHNGELLARSIRNKFKAALIDEFQDTDPLQYDIFTRIFRHRDTTLFLIGDPKQAIYSFRSADLFAYMTAAASIKNPYSLDTNWRSAPGLIRAVNTLFARNPRPFIHDHIAFQPVKPPPGTGKHRGLCGTGDPPLHIWFVRDADKSTKNDISLRIAHAVGNETARLLQARACIGSDPLGPGDIAVLVRTHAQARCIQRRLLERNVPCILHSTGNLFECHEAVELQRVLAAIAEPNREHLVRAALATDIIGLSGDGLHALLVDTAAWETLHGMFCSWHDLWNSSGFYRMFRKLIVSAKVKERLIGFPDGERRLTNLLQLAEALHHREKEFPTGMAATMKWLSEQLHADTPPLDEHQLRLESDEDAVKIVTIHKSKGLEYPVVFCPFAWEGLRSRADVVFHTRDARAQLTLDLGSPEQDNHRQQASEESMAENIRLLYVSLTRAEYRAYVVWGKCPGAETSAMAYLLHCHEEKNGASVLSRAAERFAGLTDDAVVRDLKRYEDSSGGTIRVAEMPEKDPLSCRLRARVDTRSAFTHRTFSGTADQQWRITSFSSLVTDRLHEPEFHESDEFVQSRATPAPDQAQQPEMFTFPAGARSGSLLHSILEHCDFASPDVAARQELVAEKLGAHGFDTAWCSVVCAMISNVISVALDPEEPDLSLANISKKESIAELGFYFPLKQLSGRVLKNIFSGCGDAVAAGLPERIGSLTFSPVQGYMKGFIDLVFSYENRFYLVDWKSNLLGLRREDYKQENLEAAMQDNLYKLQYYIYTLALHQYLKMRIPDYRYETHFGRVYYIFLRGIDPGNGPGYGIYRDRPPAQIIEQMSAQLIG